MGFFSKLLGRKRTEPETLTVECPHKALTPRWDNPEDMGKQALVTTYTCSACGQVLSREDGAAILGV